MSFEKAKSCLDTFVLAGNALDIPLLLLQEKHAGPQDWFLFLGV
jgi:hypothetical protein